MVKAVFDLPKLLKGENGYIFVDDIHETYRKDLNTFICGRTFTVHSSGRFAIPYPVYREWLAKIYHKGFDIPVPFEIN
jgi:hypothetical protein